MGSRIALCDQGIHDRSLAVRVCEDDEHCQQSGDSSELSLAEPAFKSGIGHFCSRWTRTFSVMINEFTTTGRVSHG